MTALFGITLLLYLVASVSYHVHVFTGSESARRVALGGVLLGVLAHTAAIGAWCTEHRGESILRDPGMPYSLVAYFLAIVQLACSFRRGWASLGAFTLPLAFIAQSYAGVRSSASGGAVESWASTPILKPHVMVLLLGFTAFALAFCLAVIYLVQARLLKTKQVKGLISRLPPLDSVYTAAHWLATVGFSMLTLGIITGAMAAPEHWGPSWYLDPRTVSSLIAWVIYAAYEGVSLGMGWRGRKTTYFLIAGFVVILVAFVASMPHHKPSTDVRARLGPATSPMWMETASKKNEPRSSRTRLITGDLANCGFIVSAFSTGLPVFFGKAENRRIRHSCLTDGLVLH